MSNLQEIVVDGPPKQVATELLLTGKLTARMRKNCWDARSRTFVSTRQPKPIAAKLNNRLLAASWAQLSKWERRTARRYSAVQKRYSQLPEIDNDEPESIVNLRAAIASAFWQLELLGDSITAVKASRIKTP